MENQSLPAFGNYEERKNMTATEIVDMFTEVASVYEHEWKIRNYTDHIRTAERAADYFGPERVQSVRVLDVAAGTGLVAQELWKRGFRNIDGVDPSEGMRDEALKKNIYTNYFMEFMDGNPLGGLCSDIYDCAVVCGAFNHGILPCSSIIEMVRLIKPGGLACFCIFDCNFSAVEEYANRLGPLMTLLEEDGVWELLDKAHFAHDATELSTIYRYVIKQCNVKSENYIQKLSEGF